MTARAKERIALEQVTVRRARPEDAQKLIDHFRRLAHEPDIFITYTPDEVEQATVEDEQASIERHNSPNSLFLVAEVTGDDSQIIADLDCNGDRYETSRHVTTLGMSIAKEWRNQGIGTAMLQQAIEWARDSGIVKRIELEVFALNEPAIHIYKKSGFEIEGCKRQYVYRSGEYFDLLLMALLL